MSSNIRLNRAVRTIQQATKAAVKAQDKRGDRNNRVTLAEWNGSNFIVEFHDAFYGDHVHYIVPFTGNSGLVAFEYVA